jgi:hypothetical protein
MGRCHVLDDLVLERGADIMDRGYVDFKRLHRFTNKAAFFVPRTKKAFGSGDGCCGLSKRRIVALAYVWVAAPSERDVSYRILAANHAFAF